jgi:hypothetical protein
MSVRACLTSGTSARLRPRKIKVLSRFHTRADLSPDGHDKNG